MYIDILGFELLARDIKTTSKHKYEDQVRQGYLKNPVRQCVESIKKKFPDVMIKEGTDNHLFVSDDLTKIFRIAKSILTIEIPIEGFHYIPFEISIDKKWVEKDSDIDLESRTSTIEFLKSEILSIYREFYKKTNNRSISESFITITDAVYHDLDLFDIEYCQMISHDNNHFYVLSVDRLLTEAKVYDFLEKLKLSKSKIYNRIDVLFVPPFQYDKIVTTLEKERMVFITGTQECGKTYAAMRLMWEYHLKGYHVKYFPGRTYDERSEGANLLIDFYDNLKSHEIIYIEDPFGKLNYEHNETLQMDIGRIMSALSNTGDTYIIITSRDDVFKKFQSIASTDLDFKKYQVILQMGFAYDYERRKLMVLNWGKARKCRWIGNDEVEKTIIESLSKEANLPTPLTIMDFCIHTVNEEDPEKITIIAKQLSQGTAKSFSYELKGYTQDKQLFLSFPFISDSFDIEFSQSQYFKLVSKLRIRDAWDFARIQKHFDYGILTSVERYDGKLSLKFAHPSYSDALKFALSEDGYPSTFNQKIFSKLLQHLVSDDEYRNRVLYVVADNIEYFSNNIRNLLRNWAGILTLFSICRCI